jgi:hypothetical protein
MIKRTLSMLFVLLLALTLAACGNSSAASPPRRVNISTLRPNEFSASTLPNGNGYRSGSGTPSDGNDNSGDSGTSTDGNNVYSSAVVGDIIQFGAFDWRVLDIQDGKALIITDKIIENKPYNTEFEDVKWETSDLRSYLNGEFYERFSESDRACIAQSQVINNDNPWYGTSGGSDTTDRIFLLSVEEVVKYFGDSGHLANIPADSEEDGLLRDEYNDDRIAYHIGGSYDSYVLDGERFDDYTVAEGEEWWWWLRSPGCYDDMAADVWTRGCIGMDGADVNDPQGGVRPSLWLMLN